MVQKQRSSVALAAQNKSREVAQLLLERNGDNAAKDKYNQAPDHHTACAVAQKFISC